MKSVLLICLAGSLFGYPGLVNQALSQQPETPKPDATQSTAQPSTVPDAPLPETPGNAQTPAPSSPIAAITGTAKPQAVGPMSLRERAIYAAHANFGVSAFVLPALGAGYTMIHPPDAYPHEWRAGGAAFARNYGSIFGEDTTGGLLHFATAAIDGEDPRYYPSTRKSYGGRVMHAIAFTFVDQGNHGGHTFALSNFVDATSAGFVGNLWEPDGFNDAAHALQRSEIQFAKLAGKNLSLEFTPELTKLYQKIRPKHGASTAGQTGTNDSRP